MDGRVASTSSVAVGLSNRRVPHTERILKNPENTVPIENPQKLSTEISTCSLNSHLTQHLWIHQIRPQFEKTGSAIIRIGATLPYCHIASLGNTFRQHVDDGKFDEKPEIW